MIKVENIETWGFEHAIRGMRNPMNSWDKSDSALCRRDSDDCVVDAACCCCEDTHPDDDYYCIGKNDLDLMRRLYKAGTEHRKYARQIMVGMDITAPLYWWKEFDTYKVGVTTNSCSTMHKIHAKEFTLDDFSHEHLFGTFNLEYVIYILNYWRDIYVYGGCEGYPVRRNGFEPKDKDAWWQMIQILPSSYNQRRTVTMNYENVYTMIRQRTGHKLDEWREFVEILKGLPYVREIMED